MPNKEQYWKNREKYLLEASEYKKKNKHTPRAIKQRILGHWRNRGVICDYDAIYEIYKDYTHCDYCNKEFQDSFDRCLDHCHTTGSPRGILCRTCNMQDKLCNSFN